MRVSFDLPDALWWELAKRAEPAGKTVSELVGREVTASVKAILRPRARRPRRRMVDDDNPYSARKPVTDEAKRAEIARLRELGWSLPAISQRTRVGVNEVGATLWDMGISTRRKTS